MTNHPGASRNFFKKFKMKCQMLKADPNVPHEYFYVAQDTSDTETNCLKYNQIKKLISIDAFMFPRYPNILTDNDWRFISFKDGMIFYKIFNNFSYIKSTILGLKKYIRILSVIFEPTKECCALSPGKKFVFVGYDILDRETDYSILTNCGTFPSAFSPSELNEYGLLSSLKQAQKTQELLQTLYMDDYHASRCFVWAIWEMR